METNDMMEQLSARRYAYCVFQRLMGDAPAAEVFEAIDAELLRESFSIAGIDEDDPRAVAFFDALAAASADAEGLSGEYARVFVGPAALSAPPWESVYRDHRRMLMTPVTLSVREAFRAQGFIPQRYRHVPDDHVALELDFLAALAGEVLEACKAGDMEACERQVESGTRFASEHLGAWVSDFANDLRKKADAPFYAAAGDMLGAFVEADTAGTGTRA